MALKFVPQNIKPLSYKERKNWKLCFEGMKESKAEQMKLLPRNLSKWCQNYCSSMNSTFGQC